MRIAVLGSGSAGNALVVDSGGRVVLIDAGFPCRTLERRLRALGIEPSAVEAVLLTHEHHDHVCGAARFAKRWGVALYGTTGTLRQAKIETSPGAVVVRSGTPFEVTRPPGGGRGTVPAFRAECFRIPHDACEPVGFVLEDRDGRRLGLLSDVGSHSHLAWARLRDLDALVLEANHDLHMLRTGPYPWHLKQRVASRHGHLSNREAAEGLPELVSERLQWVVLYHLSRTNNLPALAAEAVGEALERAGSAAEVAMTSQTESTPWLDVEVGRGAQLCF